jgi:hypothetical protein
MRELDKKKLAFPFFSYSAKHRTTHSLPLLNMHREDLQEDYTLLLLLNVVWTLDFSLIKAKQLGPQSFIIVVSIGKTSHLHFCATNFI